MPLSPGQVLIQRYRIVKLLGQGGFGAVYRAWDTSLNRPCALKENLDTSSEAQRQFEREARILANINHPNLPRVTDSFTIPNQGQYLVMDFVEGEDLKQILDAAPGPLPEERVLSWTSQICDALSYLHEQKPPIIHRDIKPANIKITPAGKAMLVDFGIAKVYDPHLKTTVGARAVTPGYSPTEQYGQGATDARTDIYALGATAYHLLTGHPPPESILRNLGTPLPPPRAFNSSTSQNTEQAILRSMQILPGDRFQSAAQFKIALAGLLHPPPLVRPTQAAEYQPALNPTLVTEPTVSTPAAFPPAPRSRPTLWNWVGGVGCLAVVVVVLLGPFISSLISKSVAPSLDLTATYLAGSGNLATVTHTQARPPAKSTDTPTPTHTPVLPLPGAPSPTFTPTFTDTPVAIITDTPTPTVTSATVVNPGDTQISTVDSMVLVYIGGYWIDQTEVTNAMYALCVSAGSCQPPAESGSATRPDYFGNSSYADYPVVKVNIENARSYCRWAGRRLPTSVEWARAAGSETGRTYPWGNSIDCGYANIKVGDNFCVGDTTAVRSYPSGVSPFGVFDLAGNLFEWVSDSCSQGNVVRGGSWNDGPEMAAIAQTYCRTPDSTSSKLGFRCAR